MHWAVCIWVWLLMCSATEERHFKFKEMSRRKNEQSVTCVYVFACPGVHVYAQFGGVQ